MAENSVLKAAAAVIVIVGMIFCPDLLLAVEKVDGVTGSETLWMGPAYISAAVAVGLACIGSGYAVAKIGSAGMGAISEKPEMMGRVLVFVGLAEGIAIYGLIIAIMILNKL